MGLDRSAFKIVIEGTIANAQGWSVSLWMAGTISPLSLDINQVAGEVQDLAAAWAGSVSPYWSSDTKYTGVSVYEYPIGSNSATAKGVDAPASPVAGGGSSNFLPTFCSAVQTLRTEKSGRSFRGRIYVPITSLSLQADGQVGGTPLTAVATATRDLISGLNDLDLAAIGMSGQEMVVASFTKSLTTRITSVHADSLMDVQHRRSDKLAASFQVTEFVS